MTRDHRLRRPVAAVLASLGWLALGLQLYLILRRSSGTPAEVAVGVLNFLSYFTILTNLLIAVALTATARSSRDGFFEQPQVATGLALHIAVVGIIYNLFLAHLWQPIGLQFLTDLLLHDVLPIGYVGYWLALMPKGQLHWRDVLPWLWYPFVYLAYSGARGVLIHRYPYPFIDVGELGYSRALGNCVLITLGLLIIGLCFIALDRAIGQRAPSRATV